MPEKLEESYRQEKGVVKRKRKGGEELPRVIRNVDWHFSPICDKVFYV